MATVSLTKGGNVNLSKIAGLTDATIGLGWKTRATDGADFDLDASVFMVTAAGKVRGPADFIFYNNQKAADGSVLHSGDNLTGSDQGDAEQVRAKLNVVPADVSRLVLAVTIHEADKRRQNFGQVTGAYMRVVNEADGQEVGRFDLTEDYSTETAMIFGEIYRNGGDWKFKAVGQGFVGGLAALCGQFGISIG